MKDRALSSEHLEGDFFRMVRTNEVMRFIQVRDELTVECRR